MAIRRPFIISIIAIGITSIAAQIVLLRELIIVFYGNEISVGLILAGWLFLGAIGSIFIGRFSDKIANRLLLFCACQLFLSIILPTLVIFIRNIRHFFGFLPGEIIPLGILAVSVPIVLAPLCITLGFLFALSCRIFPTENAALKIGHVYILEAIGATIGGLLTSLVLIKYFSSLYILLGIAIINLIACIILINIAAPTKTKTSLKVLSYVWLFAIILFIITKGPTYLEEKSLRAEWRPFAITASENSIYGNLVVAKRGSSYSFFTNGLHNFTVPDKLSQEEAVHFPLSQHKDPKKILLIGGGAGGLLWELIRHPVEEIDYVELDPLIIKTARIFLADSKYYALDDPKVNIINEDGRFFIKKASSKYDVIIVYLPDPYTAQLNRFYTKEFFEETRRVMKADAILSFSVTSSENYISVELGNFLGSIYNTLRLAFTNVAYIPGDTAYFMASQKSVPITVDHKKIAKRLAERKIETSFVNKFYLFSKLSKDRVDYMGKVLEANRDIGANFDFKPISYYYDMILWSTYFASPLRKIPLFLNSRIIWFIFVLIYLCIIIAGWASKKKNKGRLRSVLLAIATTGFSEIVFEIVVILSFQIIYGYLYFKLGLMITSFMIGLFFGSIYITKKLDDIKDPFTTFTKIQASIALYPMILPLILIIVARSRSLHISWLGSNVIFPFLPIIAGFIGGLQFPLGNKIYLSGKSGVGQIGGLTYGIDLLGACLGAIIVSTFLIPILGIFQTCTAVGLLNLAVFASLHLYKKNEKN